MQSARSAKTVWARKIRSIYSLVVALALLGFAVGMADERHDLYVGRHAYKMLHASTPLERARGLGGRSSLPANQAMLFAYDHPAVQCFWMKDMHFSLDMIWLNSTKHVVKVASNLSPATYPRTFCAPAQYVVELNAGQARADGLRLGQRLEF